MSIFYDYSLKYQGQNISGRQFLSENHIFSNLFIFMRNLNNSLKYSLGESNKYLDKKDTHNIKLAFEKTYQKKNPLYLKKNLIVYRCYKEKVSYSFIKKQKKIGRFLSTTIDSLMAGEFCAQESETQTKINILDLTNKHFSPENIIGETVEINHDSKIYYGIIINNSNYYLKVHLLKNYCCIGDKGNKSETHNNILVFKISTIKLSIKSNLFKICIQIPKNSSGVLPLLFYYNYLDSHVPHSNNYLAITNDFFSKSESPKDYYQEILLDYKGNLIPVYQTWVDPLFKKKDILIYNNCPVFKYQDRNHNHNFTKKTSKKIRLCSLDQIHSESHNLDSLKTIKKKIY